MAKRMILMVALMVAFIAGLGFIKFKQFQAMIIGTLFTLFVVPSIYVLVARAHVAVPVEEEERTAARARELAEATS